MRHETEMHRQRRELLEALQIIATMASLDWDGLPLRMMDGRSLLAYCRDTIKSCQPSCDVGLFGDRSQMDLQDRKDV